MIDTHCHLTHPRLAPEVDEVIDRARAAGIAACLTIGTGVEDAGRARELSRRHRGFVFSSAGIDPFSSHDLGDRFDAAFDELRAFLQAGEPLAIGEIGLDYHYDLDPQEVQIERLERQLALAVEVGLPVVIHVREAHADMVEVLARHPQNHGVIHSFTAGPAEAEAYLELGWYLGFNGVLTFKNADEVRQAARLAPDDRLLIETDSPYLAPVPHRGKRCEPAHVAHTLDRLADVRGASVERLAAATTENARRLFAFQ